MVWEKSKAVCVFVSHAVWPVCRAGLWTVCYKLGGNDWAAAPDALVVAGVVGYTANGTNASGMLFAAYQPLLLHLSGIQLSPGDRCVTGNGNESFPQN